jgi:sugar/nucleoside kinase (ribokinase family)
VTRIHVAGNTVVDIVVPGEPPAGGGDGWGSHTQLLDAPVDLTLGGCGAAPAYVLGQLGHEVALTTNLADDASGRLAARWLTGAGVRLGAPAAAASAVHVIHSSGRQRHSSYWRGERVDWSAADVDGAEWLLAAGYGLAEARDVDELRVLFQPVAATGAAQILFDPGPWFSGRVDAEAMRGLWRHVDILTGTVEELSAWLPAADAPVALARQALEYGPDLVVVKAGERGAAWATRDAEGQAPAMPVQGHSTGAGDSFNARLLHGLARGESPAEAVAAAVDLATRLVRAGRGILGLFPPTEGNP